MIKIYVKYIHHNIDHIMMDSLPDDIMRIILNNLPDFSFINFIRTNKHNCRYSKFKPLIIEYKMTSIIDVIEKYDFTFINYNYNGPSNFKFLPNTIQIITFNPLFGGHLDKIYHLSNLRDIYLDSSYHKFKTFINIPKRINVHYNNNMYISLI